MNKDNKKLGMGLGALLNNNSQNKNNINKIDITSIYPNKKQPRKNFEEKELEKRKFSEFFETISLEEQIDKLHFKDAEARHTMKELVY